MRRAKLRLSTNTRRNYSEIQNQDIYFDFFLNRGECESVMVAKVLMDIMCISLFIFVPFVRVQKDCGFIVVDVVICDCVAVTNAYLLSVK